MSINVEKVFDKIHDLKNSPKNRNRGEPPQLDKKDFFFF